MGEALWVIAGCMVADRVVILIRALIRYHYARKGIKVR